QGPDTESQGPEAVMSDPISGYRCFIDGSERPIHEDACSQYGEEIVARQRTSEKEFSLRQGLCLPGAFLGRPSHRRPWSQPDHVCTASNHQVATGCAIFVT